MTHIKIMVLDYLNRVLKETEERGDLNGVMELKEIIARVEAN